MSTGAYTLTPGRCCCGTGRVTISPIRDGAGRNGGDEPIQASLIVGAPTRRTPRSSPQATSQADGVLLLLRNTPQALAEQPWILRPLARAVGDAACYAGPRGEAWETAAAILQLGVIRDARRYRRGLRGLAVRPRPARRDPVAFPLRAPTPSSGSS